MTGFQAKLERFESLAAECDLIAKRSDGSNRELYLRARRHYRYLANEVRALIASFDLVGFSRTALHRALTTSDRVQSERRKRARLADEGRIEINRE
ncbi:hypothetical protein [Bradyrhizobium sp. CCBAU 53380]|uniref:hypothetical protein n=1 Tax=Bradyrhizobium sp. CCBAU 53380 TaxID=1325117 RepID=UPI0023041B3D|nr:hypothetical protein [Bradyrhizobium sp. CCBAU 53380]